MNFHRSQARIDHTVETYRRFISDLRQAIFSGILYAPIETIPCTKSCSFGCWLDGVFAEHGAALAVDLAALKHAHVVFHRDAYEIARLIQDDRPDAAHEAFHRVEFADAMTLLLTGLEEVRGHLRAAA